MAMHQFKAESKKLMDLMINSIYTNRDFQRIRCLR